MDTANFMSDAASVRSFASESSFTSTLSLNARIRKLLTFNEKPLMKQSPVELLKTAGTCLAMFAVGVGSVAATYIIIPIVYAGAILGLVAFLAYSAYVQVEKAISKCIKPKLDAAGLAKATEALSTSSAFNKA